MKIFEKEKVFTAVKENKPYLIIREDEYKVETDEKGQRIVTCFGYCPFNNWVYIGKATCMTEDMEYYSYFLGTKIAVIKANIGCLKDLIKYFKKALKEMSELEELTTAKEYNDVIKYFKKKLKYCYKDLYAINIRTRKRNYEMYRSAVEKIRSKKNGHI